MDRNNSVLSLIAVLLILLFSMVLVYSYGNGLISNSENRVVVDINDTKEGEVPVYRVISTGKEIEVENKNVIVNDRFVGKLEKDARVVSISSDGQAYNVRDGVVLVSDMVVSSDEESYKVYRIEDPEKSVSN